MPTTSPRLHLKCASCHTEIPLSLSLVTSLNNTLDCSNCKKSYHFEKEPLLAQIGRFEALCEQLKKSQDILSQSCVSVTVGSQEVKIPLRLLLTRFNSVLELHVDGKPLEIQFRAE